MVVGENQKFASAIIIPNLPALRDFAKKQKISFTDDNDLITKEPVVRLMHKEVDLINERVAAHERIKRERLIIADWTPGNNMLSQTLKLKRANIYKKYSGIINDIYKTDSN